jgi:hypothetical protein
MPRTKEAKLSFEISFKGFPPLLEKRNNIKDAAAPTRYVSVSEANGSESFGTDFEQI